MAVRWLLGVGMLLLAGCGADAAAARTGDGELVLEVGGPHPSLRQTLQALGVVLDAPVPLVVEASVEGAGAAGDPEPAPGPAPGPEPSPFVVVVLGEGQTVAHLARKHLGSANRYAEILALNGWSESDSRRLRPGTKVKIPASDAAAAGRR